MRTSPVHPVHLRFRDPATESAFVAAYDARSWPLVRAALVLGLVQYAAFGWLDQWVAPMAFEAVRAVRIAVCVVIAVGIAATYRPRVRRWLRPAEAVAIAGGLGVVAMEWAVQHAVQTAGLPARTGGLLILDGYYYSGLMLVLIYVHVLLRLRFVTASAIGAGLIALYLAVASLHTPGLQLVNAAQFLLSTQLSGMVASYALERYARHEFAHARRLAESHATLTAALDGLTAAQDRLVHAEKMASLGRVTAGVAHEIQNPLNFVTNFAALASEGVADLRAALGPVAPDVEEALDDIALGVDKVAEHGARASGVVASMLDHSRRGPSTRAAVDLNALVAEHATIAAHAAAARDARAAPVALDLDPAVGTAFVAPADLGRVVLNLLGNAYHALGQREAPHRDVPSDGPPLSVSTRRHGETVDIAVADRGVGMSPEVAARAFEPFFTTKPTGQGTGLGLSLAYEIVTEGHGGALAIESVEGEGTTVRLALPAPVARPADGTAPEVDALIPA
ncbi:sensor histidine kinase [Rubrivirga sp. IMCC43871]|uniref:sensor histidine kinase n=1 Tax=Rubrivirga sp. IMCC43871 TaxID=3391575 RepID=UPI00398FE6CE